MVSATLAPLAVVRAVDTLTGWANFLAGGTERLGVFGMTYGDGGQRSNLPTFRTSSRMSCADVSPLRKRHRMLLAHTDAAVATGVRMRAASRLVACPAQLQSRKCVDGPWGAVRAGTHTVRADDLALSGRLRVVLASGLATGLTFHGMRFRVGLLRDVAGHAVRGADVMSVT